MNKPSVDNGIARIATKIRPLTTASRLFFSAAATVEEISRTGERGYTDFDFWHQANIIPHGVNRLF